MVQLPSTEAAGLLGRAGEVKRKSRGKVCHEWEVSVNGGKGV